MQMPVQMTFRNMPVSDAVETECWNEVERLEQDFDRIVGCHVTVAEIRHCDSRRRHYDVRIDLTVPGEELVVNRPHTDSCTNENATDAVREGFDQMRVRLREYVNRMRSVGGHNGRASR